MASTPSNNRLKLTPSNSSFLGKPTARSPMRGRPTPDTSSTSRLSLKRVIGTTCSSAVGFDAFKSSFAYIAGAAVVVVDVDGESYTQRFFRARPNALPIYPAAQKSPSTPTSTPKANDSRGRAPRESPRSGQDGNSPGGNTWTSRERIKAATCLSLSRDGKYLAVGETGYAPRVLTFNLQDSSSDTPMVSLSEHAFGVKAVAWSPDSRYLASLGEANDGFLYIWRIDPRNGSARLFQQNRCTSYVRDMLWLGNSLITLGVRHVKMWKMEEPPTTSPTKQRFLNEFFTPSQKTLPGRNVLLGPLVEATFTCAAVQGKQLIVCTEAGDVCTLDDDDKQAKLCKVLNLGFPITSITIRENVVYVGGREGQFATLDLQGVLDGQDESSVLSSLETSTGAVAMGFLAHKLVTIDSKNSIDIWRPDHLPGKMDEEGHIHIPGHEETILGVQPLPKPNEMDAAFFTWSNTGSVAFWDLEGQIKASVSVTLDPLEMDSDLEVANQLTCARVSRQGKILVTSDRQGVLKVVDIQSQELLLDTRAHASDCLSISIFEDDSKFLMASCGRDRTTQLFHRNSEGLIEHFQTLEYNAKVVEVLIPSYDQVITCSTDRTMQVHDVVCKDGEPNVLAAIPSRVITLKASPTSMTISQDGKTAFASFWDRSISQFDLTSGRQTNSFKCLDEAGSETAVLDSLSVGRWLPKDMDFLLGTSNTDKSIRLYDANSGAFLDREWGHTEGINGVSLIEDEDGSKKVVSAGSDATIMIWQLDLGESSPKSQSREPSPAKESAQGRRTLRKVLSKAEMAEFQRPSTSGATPSSPPRTVRKRTSRIGLNTNAAAKTPTGTYQLSPSNSNIADDTPSRRPSADVRSSPPPSPKARATRKPSLPALGTNARKKGSNPNARKFGTLNKSTEQTCRALRTYRKKLSSTEPISSDALAELDQELRLTAAALGERAIRSKAMNETVVSELLDQYSERLVALLDEKMRVSYHPRDQGGDSQDDARSRSSDGDLCGSSP